MRRYWPHALVIVGSLVAIFFLFFGFFAGWGSSQWGPYSEWIAGGLTLGAVVIALWQAFRGEHARLVDHEMARRRECIGALSELWAGIASLSLHLPALTDYYKNLPLRFNPHLVRDDNVTPMRPGMPIAEEMAQQFSEFSKLWVGLIEPPLFVVLSLSRGTPIDDSLKELNKDLRRLLAQDLPDVAKAAMGGRRPNVDPLEASWSGILRQREPYLNMARKYFGLDIEAVEQAVAQRRKRRRPQVITEHPVDGVPGGATHDNA